MAVTAMQMSITVGSKSEIDVEVTAVSEGLFRLAEQPLLFLACSTDDEAEYLPRFGDVVFGEYSDGGVLIYKGIFERGPYRHFDYMLSFEMTHSSVLADFLKSVVMDGGRWEQHMGGLFMISIPKTSDLDPETLFPETDRKRSGA